MNSTMKLDKVAASAWKAIQKHEQRDIPYDRVPEELLCREQLDLSQWSLVVTDRCLDRVKAASQSLLILNLSGAEKISDAGLHSVAACCSALKSLHLDNAFLITGHGLAVITKHSTHLQQLSLPGTMISGASYSIIGQYCCELKILNLSGCRQITPWAFMKIFEGCIHLKNLDISFCSLVTDDQIKILSEKSSNLRQLNIRECNQISDLGLSFLSQSCPKLSEVNIRRSELPFRVSDVALLQLAQGCQNLISLNLHGCEMISDTGISWLASWCKELRHLDLSNCSKITNQGIRHVGEGCQKLRSIALLNLKRVSDVGIRCLATGCHSLESLNASRLVMLSDGMDRAFGLEGLQALGKSKCAVSMKRLVLHGCNLISALSLRAISNLVNLEVLDLSGCNKLTIDGISRIGKSCGSLRQISLASCGDCVGDSFVEQLVAHSTSLTTVNLSYCQRVGKRSLRALSRCKKLQFLDLTGCTGVSDQSILHLCDGEFVPGLRHLILAGCKKVEDTTLSWITDGLMQGSDGSVSLEKLSLKGTSITIEAARGVADRFPYSSFKQNASFVGFWPMSRVDDRKIIDSYYKRSSVCTTIQARYRSRKEKGTLKLAKEQYCKRKIAVWLGARYRGAKARRLFIDVKRQQKNIIKNTLMIQCAFRIRMSKKTTQRLREKRWSIVTPHASTIIQRHWRGILGRRKALEIRNTMLEHLETCFKATIRIQAWSRMLFAKKRRVLLQCRHFTFELNKFRSSIKIQCYWRRYLAINLLSKMKFEFERQEKLRVASLSRISSLVRSRFLRKTIQRRIARTKRRLKASLLIQNWFRRETERLRQRQIAERKLAKLRVMSAILIQGTIRRRLAYMTLLRLRQYQEEMQALKKTKAIILCRWGRVCIARLRVQKRRIEYDEEVKNSLILKVWAATKIEAAYRGKRGRDIARAKIHESLHRWKALFDKTEKRPFYYNQNTGETRWEKPQVLLNSEPRPVCGNCYEYQAEIECANCEEFFCTRCWEFIHMGGRRRHHSFRTLYDYYGNRKDYDNDPWLQIENLGAQGEVD